MTIPAFRAIEAGRAPAIGLGAGAGFVIGYLALCALGLILAPDLARPACMPFGAGLALAFLLVGGARRWPVVLAAALAAQLLLPLAGLAPLDARALALAAALAVVATAEAWAGRALLARWHGAPRHAAGPAETGAETGAALHLEGWRDLGRLAVLAGGLALAGATAGAGAMQGLARIWPGGPAPGWPGWAAVDAAGLLLVTPAALLGPWAAPGAICLGGRALPRLGWGGALAILAALAASLAARTAAEGAGWPAAGLLLAGLAFTILLAVHLLSRRMGPAGAATLPPRDTAGTAPPGHLDLALGAARIAVFEVEPATGAAVYSPTWKALLGLPAEAAIEGRDAFLALVHPEDRPALEAADAACIAGRAERSVAEFRVRMPDGGWRWMRTEAVAEARDAGGHARRLVGVQADIDELVRGREALRASEEMIGLAIKAAPIGMAILGLDGRFQQVNDALGAFVGLERSEITGRNLDSLVHPDAQAWLAESVAGLLLGTRDKAEAALRCLHEDGSEIWGNLSIAVVRDSLGRALSFVLQVQDIDAQKKLERAKGEFIATVSHELRTPLTSIGGSLGLMLNGVAGELPEPARRMLAIAQKNASRLILLVNDILDMESLSAGKMGFAFEDVDVATVVRRSVADIRKAAEATGLTVAADLARGALLVRADPARLQQVLTNFLSNAVKFSPPQGRIEIGAAVDETAVRIWVTDHGPGVPPAFRSKIFLAFSQADSSATRSNEGTGLGLAISRQLVERMGGRIGFETDPGHATTFWCALPRAAAPQPGADAAAPGRPCVLHVEADAGFAGIVRTAFGPRAEIVHAASAAEAAALLRARRFDLLLLDDGTAAGGAPGLIDRFLRGAPDAPVMALTANDSPARDPRVQRSFLKTRAAVQRTVSACLGAIAARGGGRPPPGDPATDPAALPPADDPAAGAQPARS